MSYAMKIDLIYSLVHYIKNVYNTIMSTAWGMSWFPKQMGMACYPHMSSGYNTTNCPLGGSKGIVPRCTPAGFDTQHLFVVQILESDGLMKTI